MLIFFDADPGCKKFGSGINIPDLAVGMKYMQDFNHLYTFFICCHVQDMLAIVATACEVCLMFVILYFLEVVKFGNFCWIEEALES
jgi:hypothetical protein